MNATGNTIADIAEKILELKPVAPTADEIVKAVSVAAAAIKAAWGETIKRDELADIIANMSNAGYGKRRIGYATA